MLLGRNELVSLEWEDAATSGQSQWTTVTLKLTGLQPRKKVERAVLAAGIQIG